MTGYRSAVTLNQTSPLTPGSHPLDVLGVGFAIVDVLAHMPDEFLVEQQLAKGHMQLVDLDRSSALYKSIGPAIEISGGSSANTVAGVVSMGGTGGFIGTVVDDQLGRVFTHDMRATGVRYDTLPIKTTAETARSIVVITPDSQRTMSTYLGAAAELNEEHIDDSLFVKSSVVFLEGYVFDLPWGEKLYNRVASRAHEHGCQVSLTLSDPFVINSYRSAIESALDDGVEILFANEEELLTLYPNMSFEDAVELVKERSPYVAITRSEKGSLVIDHGDIHSVSAIPTKVVDTTGAGDMYAAGFLYGYTHGEPIARCGELGSIAAAEIISHVGARPEVPLREFVKIARTSDH